MTLLLLSAAAATVVLGSIFFAQFWMRHGSAALRHAAWTVGLAVTLLLPLWIQWKPADLPSVAPLPAATRAVAQATGIVITVRPDAPGLDWRLALWALGAAAVLARHGVSLYHLRRLRRDAQPVAPGVYAHAGLTIPLTYGLFRPVILVPAAAAADPLVLHHERAHIARGDLFAHAVATLATAFFWFHPLVWLAAVRARREAEFAVDDLIVTATAQPAAYAERLLAAARQAASAPAAAISMAQPSQLEGRLVAILDPHRNRRPINRVTWAGLALSVAAIAFPLGVLAQGVSSLAGTVRDATGVVPNATVVLLDTKNAERYRTVSMADGGYTFSGVEAGEYHLEVRAPGFELQRLSGLRITGAGQRLDHYLQVGRIHETVQVAAQGTAQLPPGRPERIRVGGNVEAANLIEKVTPIYPASMKEQGIQGTVFLRAVISKTGEVVSLQVLSAPHVDLAESAKTAVRQWRYRPVLLNGEPIEVITDITVNYTLTQ